ncbi:MAG: conserved predicted rane protein [Phenylobacterium sp.]|nr:conserved predicted rane protein [Phenylobacterium sp.]
MSSIPQTPARRRLGFRAGFALSLVVVAAILALTMGPSWRGIAGLAGAAHPHLPQIAAVQKLPLAIRLHIACALGALGLGAALMLVRKGRRFHRVAGWVWVSLVSLVAGSSLFITSLHPGRYSLLHLFTGWTLLVLPLGVLWAKRHEVARHRRVMMGLFYGGFAVNIFIAFIPGRTMWNLIFG